MPVSVNLQTVHPRKLAAVRREVAPGPVGSAWGPALGKVWEFIRSQPGLRTDGHNIFLYHHPTQRSIRAHTMDLQMKPPVRMKAAEIGLPLAKIATGAAIATGSVACHGSHA